MRRNKIAVACIRPRLIRRLSGVTPVEPSSAGVAPRCRYNEHQMRLDIHVRFPDYTAAIGTLLGLFRVNSLGSNTKPCWTG